MRYTAELLPVLRSWATAATQREQYHGLNALPLVLMDSIHELVRTFRITKPVGAVCELCRLLWPL